MESYMCITACCVFLQIKTIHITGVYKVAHCRTLNASFTHVDLRSCQIHVCTFAGIHPTSSSLTGPVTRHKNLKNPHVRVSEQAVLSSPLNFYLLYLSLCPILPLSLPSLPPSLPCESSPWLCIAQSACLYLSHEWRDGGFCSAGVT